MSKLTTTEKKPIGLKGFTLMEVLVAAVIFSIVMALAAAIIAQGSGYSGKLKRMRETSEGARRIADMITRDVKEANTPVVLNSNYLQNNLAGVPDVNDKCDSTDATEATKTVTFKSAIVFVSWRPTTDTNYDSTKQSYCIESEYTYEGAIDGILKGNGHGLYDSKMLILGMKDRTRVYVNVLDAEIYKFYMKDFMGVSTQLGASELSSVAGVSNLVSNANYNTMVGFGGHSPITPPGLAAPKPTDSLLEKDGEQPIVRFNVTVETKDYDKVNYRGEIATIRSVVTSRNYDL